MKHKIILLIVCVVLALPLMVFSHGVEHKILDKGAGVEVFYMDGTPMGDCDVEVFSPADSEIPFQRGQMDKNGRFVFFPDQIGTWKVVVNDGMGHQAKIEVLVNKELKTGAIQNGELKRWQKIMMVLCLIFGLTGVYYYFLTRRKYLTLEKTRNNDQ